MKNVCCLLTVITQKLIGNDMDQIIKELFNLLLNGYQIPIETAMRGSGFVC